MPRRYLFVMGTFLLSVLLYVDRICISTARDPIRGELGLTDTQFGWILAAFSLGYALFQSPSGWLADRLGARRVLSTVVVIWSAFTGLTAGAWNLTTMVIARFLFGAGEAGAFPGMARASYSWIPMSERGVVQGINFSGSRLGAAFALPVLAWMVATFGWRFSFVMLMFIGFGWAVFWFVWFRDDPTEHKGISQEELDHILKTRQQAATAGEPTESLRVGHLLRSRNMWLLAAQYICSNFTFFFCLTWLYTHVKERFDLDPVVAGVYAAVPLVAGAVGNWSGGWLVDRIYRRGRWTFSRLGPAVMGYILASIGIIASIWATSPLEMVVALSIAIFGADMTLPPSWSVCMDIGRKNAGMVSGTMNMFGNFGAMLSPIAFPFLGQLTADYVPSMQSYTGFFAVAAVFNILAILFWLAIRPNRLIEQY